jgi:hypothetical protein
MHTIVFSSFTGELPRVPSKRVKLVRKSSRSARFLVLVLNTARLTFQKDGMLPPEDVPEPAGHSYRQVEAVSMVGFREKFEGTDSLTVAVRFRSPLSTGSLPSKMDYTVWNAAAGGSSRARRTFA